MPQTDEEQQKVSVGISSSTDSEVVDSSAANSLARISPMRRSKRGRNGLLLVVAISGVIGAIGFMAGSRLTSPEQIAANRAAPTPSPILIPVTREVLQTTLVTRGSLEYVGEVPIQLAGPVGEEADRQIVTIAPSLNEPVKAGEVIAEVSGRPVLVLGGDVPMYRTIRPKSAGNDVAQLQQALIELGFELGAVDGVFGRSTQTAVRDWYLLNGYVAKSGSSVSSLEVPAGELVFLPELPAKVTDVSVKVGSDADDVLAVVARNELVAVAGVTVAEAELMDPGAEVTMSVDNSSQTFQGRVSRIGDSPEATGDLAGNVRIEVVPDESEVAADLVAVSLRLTVKAISTGGEPVLTVPASAVVTGIDGLTVVWATMDATEELRPVEVTTGLATQGRVEVRPLDPLSLDEDWLVEIGREFDTEPS